MTTLDDIQEERAHLVDVRSDEEWEAERVKGATHWPMDRLEREGPPPFLDPKRKIYIHCVSGNRATHATLAFLEIYSDVVPLGWNVPDFAEAGFEIE